ncbi:Hpt domain-containing protein [Desulfohalovibrio reitneri]|uniref:Hpt domain-containing protein n=1 Tax=Desulfohalovibrio reitneri TaxID=1307759 RepID=UPI00054E627D|nr:Hpt domain-containing protein [Desulfohalovibrio reitneri]
MHEADDRRILDTELSLRRLEGEREFLAELYRMFLEDSVQRRRTLEEALSRGEYQDAAKAAHSLKGMCGTINAPALMELALEMEKACRGEDDDRIEALRGPLRKLLDEVLGRIEAFLAT